VPQVAAVEIRRLKDLQDIPALPYGLRFEKVRNDFQARRNASVNFLSQPHPATKAAERGSRFSF
jgi:hypothetical protein